MKKVLFIALLFVLSGSMAMAQKGNQGKQGNQGSQLSAEARVEKRINRLDQSLELTDQQKLILQKDMLRIEKAREEAREASIAQRQQRKGLREEEKSLMKKTLTAEQFKKLEQLQQEQSREMKKRKSMQAAPAQKQGE